MGASPFVEPPRADVGVIQSITRRSGGRRPQSVEAQAINSDRGCGGVGLEHFVDASTRYGFIERSDGIAFEAWKTAERGENVIGANRKGTQAGDSERV